jgi:hypothetical protein
MAGKLVTLATFGSSTDAHLARMRVEAAGIECFLDNENIVDANWLWSSAVGGVRLKVPEEDAAAALEALKTEVKGPPPAVPDAPGPPCPRCGAPDMMYQQRSPRELLVSLLLLGFPIPFLGPTWKCRQCRREWSVKRLAAMASGKAAPQPRRMRWIVILAIFLAALLLGVFGGQIFLWWSRYGSWRP